MPQPDAGRSTTRNPWLWVPTLYFAEGLPNLMVATVAVVLYKSLGISNARITFYTGLMYLPWVIKPLWSPVVEVIQTRRRWIWLAQWVVAATLAGIGIILNTPYAFPLSVALFWVLAFSSATHDIAADGFYMLALAEHQQSFFVGIRNMLYRAATLFVKGPFIVFAAALGARHGNVPGWSLAFLSVAALVGALGGYHAWILPRPSVDLAGETGSLARVFAGFRDVFADFFRRPGLGRVLAFLLFYRFGEALLLPMVQTFLLDPRERGGLGLAEGEFGLVYGTAGVIALMAGGVAGGVCVFRNGLRAWLWPMVFVMHLPGAVFIYLAHAQPEGLGLIAACVAIEQFGYGFGFTAYMLYMILIARGAHQTAHYALCTGFMALGLMLPGMGSGWLQQQLGYPLFFTWTLIATATGFAVTALIQVDKDFGRKT